MVLRGIKNYVNGDHFTPCRAFYTMVTTPLANSPFTPRKSPQHAISTNAQRNLYITLANELRIFDAFSLGLWGFRRLVPIEFAPCDTWRFLAASGYLRGESPRVEEDQIRLLCGRNSFSATLTDFRAFTTPDAPTKRHSRWPRWLIFGSDSVLYGKNGYDSISEYI